MTAPPLVGSLERDVDRLSGEAFDWLIVGGGAYGVALLFEAARRGRRALLLEAEDFGGETSWHSLRILHGGFRYLQTLDLGRFRQSMAERRWFLRHFPDLAAPLDCLLPLYGEGLRRPPVFRLALPLDALLSLDRNAGVEPSRHLRAGRVLSREATLGLVPGLRADRLQGAAFWQDGAMARSEALLVEWLRWAVALGGAALNRMRVRRITVEGGRASGVVASDGVGGGEVSFRAGAVVNAAGPWSRALAAGVDRDRPALFHGSLAFNLLLDRAPVSGDVAVAVEPGDVGTLFLHPHQGRILVGTRHLAHPGPLTLPASAQVPEAAINGVLEALNRSLRGFDVGLSDVVEVRAGYLPATAPGLPTQAKRPVIVDHGADGGPIGLHSVSGVKWTTARAVAASFFDGQGLRAPAVTPARPLPVGLDLDAAAFLALDPGAAQAWLARMRRDLAATTIEDVMRRRTYWAADPAHGDAARARLAGLWQAEPVPLGMAGA